MIDCSCPNEAAHTHGDPTGYAIINDGMSYCNHSGCQGLRSHDFQDLIVERYETKMQAAYALGVVIDSPFDGKLVDARTGQPVHMTGGGFMAAIRFEAHPLVGEASNEEVEDMATRMAGRKLAAEAGEAEALRYWTERLIFVNQSGAFWDRERMTLRSADEVDRHEDVLEHYPLTTGAKRASTQFLNAGRALQHVHTQVRRGFRPDQLPNSPIVSLTTANALSVSAVNTFTPSRVGIKQGLMPQIFLDHLKMLFPGQDFIQRYLLECLAWRIQNPAGLTSIVPAILAGQGVGKDIMLNQIWKLLGNHNVTRIRVAQIASSFNSYLASPNIYLDEMSLRGPQGKLIYENIKAYTGVCPVSRLMGNTPVSTKPRLRPSSW